VARRSTLTRRLGAGVLRRAVDQRHRAGRCDGRGRGV
jgi:hypothetical protein